VLYQTQHFGLTEYFHKEIGKNFSFPMHIHHSFEFITILKGSMTVWVGKDKYELKKEEGILIFPEQLHSLESSDSEHLLFIFSTDIVSSFYSKHSSELPKCARLNIPPHLISEILKLDGQSSIIKLKGVLYSLCAMFDDITEYTKKKALEEGLLYFIFNFIENNFDKSCTLNDLGNAIGYNPSYLSRYFSDSTGMSFVSFVNQYKISRACHMLKNSNKTVLECAYDCGYKSLRSFNRNFKLYAGVSPKDYRASK
jgi:AraC-like DNA-binding protein